MTPVDHRGAETATTAGVAGSRETSLLPLDRSLGNQIRMTHRSLQRFLQARIGPYGVTLGMWYYLRALWDEDGLTQAELSRRIGTMEPTTLSAIQEMERRGLVQRARNDADRRKIDVFLTEKGRDLQARLLPLAVDVVDTAALGFSAREVPFLLALLRQIQLNIESRIRQDGLDASEDGAQSDE